jgi:hypothetical protein
MTTPCSGHSSFGRRGSGTRGAAFEDVVRRLVEVGGAGVGCAGDEDDGGSPLLLERSCL